MENKRIKPKCKLSDKDGNIFNLLAVASRTLKDIGMSAEADEMWKRATSSQSYDEALGIIFEYVTVT